MQETIIDNTTPSVVSLVDEDKNDKSATCLASHNPKSDRSADKSTQMPVPFDKCSTSLEYETIEKPHQCSEISTIRSQTPVPIDEYLSSLGYETMTANPHHCQSSESSGQMPIHFDECLSSLGYESMTGKPYQCSETFNGMTKCSQTSVEFSHHAIPRKVGPGFLVYECQGTGEKPNNLHINADHTTNDITVMSSATLQLRAKYDKSANCLANERSNPIGPLDQSSASSDELLSELEYESVTITAQQCTEESTDGFLYKSGHHSVVVSSKTTVSPQEMDCTLYAGSPGCGFWPTTDKIDDKAAIKNSDEKMLLLPTLRHFLSMAGENYEVEQDI